jgi:archaetidylinositol phosphate synthase
MIETHLRKIYQKYCIDCYLHFKIFRKIDPKLLTCFACLLGISTLPLLAFNLPLLAFLCLIFSGFLDTLDGSLARMYQKTSPKGAAFDILSDRLVEFCVILGLYCVDPTSRALPTLCMLGSVLICVTSFLVVGIFTENNSEKGFHYSPGLIERAEAFIFFAVMILFPSTFLFLSYLFTGLVFITACIRMFQFSKQC